MASWGVHLTWFDCKPAVIKGPAKTLLTQIGAKKRRVPQAVPHAIPQTHSAFYPHRFVAAYLKWSNHP